MRDSDKKIHDAMVELGFPDLAERAAGGEWNDYFGQHAMNMHHLVETLGERMRDFPSKASEIKGVILRVMSGDFDATKAEAEEWAASDEGKSMFADLLRGR